MRDLNQFKGCLVGGAVGDALGYAVEFMSASSIFHTYGKTGITAYELRRGLAEISDDTQMTLFTAAGLLRGTTRGRDRGIMGDYAEYIAQCYQDWYRTQTERFPLPDDHRYCWLVNIPEMFHRRAPGSTCLSALSRGGNGRIDKPINQSKGCGGVMRVAPIGVYFADSDVPEEDVDLIGAKAAALTHGHDLGYIPAAMLVHILQRITRGESILDAVQSALAAMPALFPHAAHMREMIDLVNRAVRLAGTQTGDLEAIRQLGEGWVAEETLAIAVYCAIKYADSFEKGVIAAVNHDGDSDSTGAVVGNILGASLGYDAIPKKFTDRLELRDVILEIAQDLYRDCPTRNDGPSDENWDRKYVLMSYDMK